MGQTDKAGEVTFFHPCFFTENAINTSPENSPVHPFEPSKARRTTGRSPGENGAMMPCFKMFHGLELKKNTCLHHPGTIQLKLLVSFLSHQCRDPPKLPVPSCFRPARPFPKRFACLGKQVSTEVTEALRSHRSSLRRAASALPTASKSTS